MRNGEAVRCELQQLVLIVLIQGQRILEHVYGDLQFYFPVLLYQSLAEQIIDMENVCGQFPEDKYFVHGGKTVSISKLFFSGLLLCMFN